MGNKFKIKLKVTGFELEIEGSREDVPLMAQAVGQQMSGLLTPASNIVEGEIIENKELPPLPSEAKPKTRKKRSSRQYSQTSTNSTLNGKGKAVAFDWKHEPLKWGTPQQDWSTAFKDILLVQRTDLTAEEEILVLLHYAGEIGFSRYELGRYAQCSASSVTKTLQKLSSPQFRQIILVSKDQYRLTDLGSKRLREELADKLLLQ